jgi:hypothetical protein
MTMIKEYYGNQPFGTRTSSVHDDVKGYVVSFLDNNQVLNRIIYPELSLAEDAASGWCNGRGGPTVLNG